MVDLTLVNYIRQLLQMGYDINSIRSRLINSGYGVGIVDEAVNYASQPKPGAAPKAGFFDHLKSKKFIVAFSLILLLIIIVLVVLTLGGGAEPIDLFVSLDSTQVVQGDDLSFSKTLVNAEEAGMVSLQYTIIDQISGNTAVESQESFSTQSVKRGTSIKIPAGTPPGAYTLIASARYGEQRVEKRYTFNVLEKIEETAEEEQEESEEEIPETSEEPDNDNDGIPDSSDTDDDNDGIQDTEDSMPLDHDNDGIADSFDDDIDDDGIPNKFDDSFYDRDNDGIMDLIDTDSDNDGVIDSEDLYPFDYDNDGVFDKDDDATGRAYSLPEEMEAAELSFSCSNNLECNDYDICTSDLCAEGFCEHERQAPCCGNFVCEEGETTGSCVQDCRAAATAGGEEQELIDEIIEIAQTNPEKAASSCALIESTIEFDRCYTELAKTTDNSAFCDRIYSADNKDKCYMYFVMSKDQFGLCDKVQKKLLRNSCYAIKTLKSGGLLS